MEPNFLGFHFFSYLCYVFVSRNFLRISKFEKKESSLVAKTLIFLITIYF
jgi:hypothetical protein